jgi:hypothetical protein
MLASSTLSPHQEDGDDRSLPHFVLNMLYPLILADEYYTGRTSCMRIFLHMDVLVFERGQKFYYFVNDLILSTRQVFFYIGMLLERWTHVSRIWQRFFISLAMSGIWIYIHMRGI